MPTKLEGTRRRPRRYGVIAAIAALALVAAACGDDDDDNGNGAAETTAPAETGDLAAFCEDYVILAKAPFGPPDPGVDAEATAQRLQDNAPPEIADDVDDFVAALQEMGGEEGGQAPGPEDTTTDDTATDDTGTDDTATDDTGTDAEEGGEEGGPPSEEFITSSIPVGRYAAENCADDQIEVTALNYEYEGIPETLTAGEYGWLLENEADEWHEIVLLKKNEGVTESFQELLELPEDEVFANIEILGAAFAGPGESSGVVTELVPGEYLAICFFPVGTTSLDVEPEGAPHHTEGMLHEFTVTAA
jgi:hypothetical protein